MRPLAALGALVTALLALGAGHAGIERAAPRDVPWTMHVVDGDGSLDVVGAQGGGEVRAFDGHEPGIRVFWGPSRARVANPKAWRDARRIPATIGRGHYHWVLARDVSRDGAVDLLVGGRALASGRRAGVAWIEAPAARAKRRDLRRWRLHPIDPVQPSGHGFVSADLDGDGDADLVLANADLDTGGGCAWRSRSSSARASTR